jgi:hypothetical protein
LQSAASGPTGIAEALVPAQDKIKPDISAERGGCALMPIAPPDRRDDPKNKKSAYDGSHRTTYSKTRSFAR